MSPANKHFGMAAWTDFSRGLVLEDVSAVMEAHLAGCANCTDIALFLNKMTTVSSRLGTVTAPADAVRLAKALFPVRPVPKRITRILAELIFDSHLAPAPAGIRSTWNVGWQCLYRAGD